MKKLKLAWMYPDILNLHGERGSVMAFARVAEKLGIELETVRIENPDISPGISDFDIMFFGPGELRVMPMLKDALSPLIPALESYIAAGKYIIALGTTGALFAGKTLREDGSVIEGLGLLDEDAEERTWVWGDDLWFSLEDGTEIIGSQIQMLNFKVDKDSSLGKTLYGFGSFGAGTEGCRTQNLIHTNCLGPVFVKNPWWAEMILRELASLPAEDLSPAERRAKYPLENQSFDATVLFNKEKEKTPFLMK